MWRKAAVLLAAGAVVLSLGRLGAASGAGTPARPAAPRTGPGHPWRAVLARRERAGPGGGADPAPTAAVPDGYDRALTGGMTIEVRFGDGSRLVVSSGGCRGRARVALLRRAAALRVPAHWTAALVQAAQLRRAAADNAREILAGR